MDDGKKRIFIRLDSWGRDNHPMLVASGRSRLSQKFWGDADIDKVVMDLVKHLDLGLFASLLQRLPTKFDLHGRWTTITLVRC